MLHKEFFGLIFLGFVFWILVATSPTQRIEHACRPVGWTGNVITSLSALVLPNQQTVVQGWFDKLEYGCQYTTWRLFYQDDYNKWKATQQKTIAPAASSDKKVEPAPVAPAGSGTPEKAEGSPIPPPPEKTQKEEK